MKTMLVVLFLLAMVSVGPCLAAQEMRVLSGLPAIRYDVSSDESRRTKLGAEDSRKSAVVVVRIANEYFWKSRENRKLVYSYPGTGSFHYFIDPRGGGYVKVGLESDGRASFVEHITVGLSTITYFGSAEAFAP